MMMAVDRAKYMDADEARQLRTVTEARHITDLKAGRVGGVTAWMLVDLGLSTGLRVKEISRLRLADIDLKRGALTIHRAKKKSDKPESLAIGKDLVRHLQEYIEWKKLAEQPTDAEAALFNGARGPLTAQGLQRIWKASIKRAGLPPELSIHSARHTLAVHLLKKTGNLRQVQKQLGHSSPATTANMYADVSFEDMQNGVNGLYDS